jgi:hypothetical protein
VTVRSFGAVFDPWQCIAVMVVLCAATREVVDDPQPGPIEIEFPDADGRIGSSRRVRLIMQTPPKSTGHVPGRSTDRMRPHHKDSGTARWCPTHELT